MLFAGYCGRALFLGDTECVAQSDIAVCGFDALRANPYSFASFVDGICGREDRIAVATKQIQPNRIRNLAAVTPDIRIRLVLEESPLRISTSLFATPKYFASTRTNSSFAAPSTGGAEILTLKFPSCSPTISDFEARGTTRTLNVIAPSFRKFPSKNEILAAKRHKRRKK